MAVLERISDGILAFDAGMNYTFLNERAGELLGRPAEELVGRNLGEEYADAGHTPFMEACQRALETRSVVWLNEYFPPTDRWLEGRVYPSEDGVSVLFSEMEPRTEAENGKQNQLEELSRFPAQNPAPVMRFTRAGRMLYANPACASLLAAWEEEGDRSASLRLIRQLLPEVLDNHLNREIEIENDGRVFTCLFVPFPQHGYVNLYFRDITAYKQSEAALRDSEEKYRRIVETANEGIWEIDQNTKTVFVNTRMAEMLGYTVEEMLGRSSFEFIFPADQVDGEERLARAKQGLPVRSGEFKYRHKNGSPVWTLISSSPQTDAQGNFLGSIALFMDITERKQAAEELAEVARQQEALFHLADNLHSADSLQDVFDTSLDSILSALQCDRASILLFDDLNVMRFVAWRGLSDAYRQATDGHSPWKREEQDAHPIWMNDVARGDLEDRLRDTIQVEGIAALAFIPLIANGNLMGKFMVYFNKPHVFEEAEIELSQTIAHQLASSIERKRAGEELRQSKQRLALTYHHAPIGINETSLAGNFIRVNDEYCRMLGYTFEELTRLNIKDVTHPEDIDDFELYKKLVAGEIPSYRIEKRYIRKNGDLLWGEVIRSIVRDENGKVLYGIGGVLDVTLRKQKEEELRARTEEIEALMEVSPVGIFYAHDPECNRITANPAGYHLLGMAEDSSSNISHLAPENERPSYRTYRNGVELKPEELPMQSAARLGMEIEEEALELRFENGLQKYLYAYAKPLFDGQGNVRGAVGSMLDITERKRAEEILRLSEERFTSFMHHLPGLAWIKDIKGRYVFANATAQKAFNATPEMLYGKTDWEIFPPEIAVQFNRNDVQAVAEEKGVQVVETLPQEDGLVHHSLVTKFPIPGPDGRPGFIGGTAFDITERIEIENALQVARTRAEHSAFRMTQLQKVTAALSQAVTPAEVAQMVVEQGAPVLGAISSSVMRLNEEDQFLEILYSSSTQSVVRSFARFPLSMQTPASDAIRLARPIWIETQAEYMERYPQLAKAIQEWGHQAAVAVPIVYKNLPLGALAMSFDKKLSFSAEDLDYILTLARQAAQALERARVESALRLDATMMENVSAGIYLIRASDGTLIHTNPKFDSLFGYTAGEVIGRHVSILNAPTNISPEEIASKVVDILNKDGAWQGQVLSRRKDGTEFWAFSSVTTFEHPTYGRVWVAARQDISAQKQAEEGLRESEHRYRAIVSQATAGIVRKDPTGRLLFVNQAFCDMLDYNEAELKGRRIWEVTHPEDVGENKRLYDRLIVEGIPFQFEKRMIRKNGSILWTSVSVSPVMDDHGKPVSAVSVYVDVTRRRLAEHRLALLTHISELTREYDDPDELFYAISKVVGEHFQVKRALFNEIDVEQNREVVHRDYCRGVPTVAGEHAISDYSSVTSAEMIAGKTVVNNDSKLDPRTAPDYERSYVEHGERAYVAVPLLRNEGWVASLWVSDDQPREWDRDDVYLLEAIAERTWTAAEKLRVDRALRDSEERLRVTFNTTVIGFATLRPDTQFTDVNDAFCHLVGYSRQELLGMNYEGITHPKFSEATKKQVSQLLSGEAASFTIEKIFVRRDGTEIWVQNSLSLVRNADGKPNHLIAICQDITERKRTEEALQQLNLELEERVKIRTLELQAANEFLRESEATSRLILESMPDAIVIIDRDGHIVHANTKVENLFGYTPGEVMEQPVEILLPPRVPNRQVRYGLLNDEQRNRGVLELGQELFGRRKDESEFPVEVKLAPIDNSTNWDVLVAIRDNTQQRQAQEALRSNEEKLRSLFEILPVGISFLDKDGKISELNTALTDILGFSRKELLAGGNKFGHYIRADGSPMPPSEFASNQARAKQRTIYNVETGIVKDNGEVTWTSVNASPVKVADVEAVVVTIDITERKRAEEALHRHRERLKALSRRLVEVQEEERHAIARELHDRVGQNLAALTLNLNILRNQLSGEILEKVGTRLNDSVNLVKDILTITRSVMADLRPNVLDDYGLDAALSEYADRFTQRYGIRVIMHVPDKVPPRLDPGVEMTLLRIAQEALTNIARHAQANQAVMSLEMQDEAVLLTIEDNGQGILSWQKVNQPGSHGLRIMRERAEAFGGYLKINSTYKNGTTIEVKIPLANSVPGKVSKEKKS